MGGKISLVVSLIVSKVKERTYPMKKYRMKGPDGSWWETTAKSLEKARANFAFRLKQAGMFAPDAYAWVADTEEEVSASKDAKIYISDQEIHDQLLRNYIDSAWEGKDVEVDWEWSGPGTYRIHEHNTEGTGLPCISLKWEGI